MTINHLCDDCRTTFAKKRTANAACITVSGVVWCTRVSGKLHCERRLKSYGTIRRIALPPRPSLLTSSCVRWIDANVRCDVQNAIDVFARDSSMNVSKRVSRPQADRRRIKPLCCLVRQKLLPWCNPNQRCHVINAFAFTGQHNANKKK